LSNDPDLIVSPEHTCPECQGEGWFTETATDSADRDADIDWPCQGCDQTGVTPQ
jgi:DnaJ-class molecular chaperone